MNQSLNNVYVDGIVNEIDLKEGTKDGKNYIAGRVTVYVEQTVEDKRELEEIPIEAFAYEFTKAGKESSAYKQLKALMTDGVSISATGNAGSADRISVGGGSVSISQFAKDGVLYYSTKIRGSFFNKPSGTFSPRATFENVIVVRRIYDEIVDDVPTGRIFIDGVIVNYDKTVSVAKYVVENPSAIQYINSNYNKGDTVKVSGAIRYAVEMVEKEPETVGFGTPEKHEFKKTRKELVILSGSAGALDGESAYDVDEIAVGIRRMEAEGDKKLAESKTGAKEDIRGF